jgi:alkylhydroperoxidase/carboxymuconolactone decarboxylase family protein YurZ
VIQARTHFNGPFQDFITRYAWGEIWSRPGLPRHTRSLITLAMMVALNREDEFKMHTRAAVNNGVTRDEIQELLVQTAVYCGLPAAITHSHGRKRRSRHYLNDRVATHNALLATRYVQSYDFYRVKGCCFAKAKRLWNNWLSGS